MSLFIDRAVDAILKLVGWYRGDGDVGGRGEVEMAEEFHPDLKMDTCFCNLDFWPATNRREIKVNLILRSEGPINEIDKYGRKATDCEISVSDIS